MGAGVKCIELIVLFATAVRSRTSYKDFPLGAPDMATATLTKPAAKGGSFLLESPQPGDVFTPADLTDDQKLIGQTAEEFVLKEVFPFIKEDRKSTRLNSSHGYISYAVFCLKKKKNKRHNSKH